MAFFKYKALDQDGDLVVEELELGNEDKLKEYLMSRKLVLVEIVNISHSTFSVFDRLLLLIPLSKKAAGYFMLEFMMLLKSGVSLSAVLDTISNKHVSRRIRLIAKDVQYELMKGRSIWEAFGKYRRTLRNVFSLELTLDAGAGKITDVLDKIYSARMLKSSVFKQIFYDRSPQFVSLLMLLILFCTIGRDFYMAYVEEIYRWGGTKEVPEFSSLIYGIMNNMFDFWYILIGYFIGMFFIFYLLKRIYFTRWIIDFIALYLYPISRLVRALSIDSFLSTLSLMLAWGLPMQQAIWESSKMIDNVVLRARAKKLVRLLECGMPLEKAVTESKLFSWWEQQVFSIPSRESLKSVLAELVVNNKERLKYHCVAASQAIRFIIYFMIVFITGAFYQGWILIYLELLHG